MVVVQCTVYSFLAVQCAFYCSAVCALAVYGVYCAVCAVCAVSALCAVCAKCAVYFAVCAASLQCEVRRVHYSVHYSAKRGRGLFCLVGLFVAPH